VVWEGVSIPWVLGACVALLFASYGWGYTVRAFKVINYPSLLNLPRRRYSEVWDALAASPSLARAAACGHESERRLRRSAEIPVNNLIELAGVSPQDDILEVGCGVARVGLELSRRCHSWTGTDISANMLATAAERLQGTNNTQLIKLRGIGLDELESHSFDLVYLTNMLSHLDEMDRWRYAKDAFRVLRPGGRLFIDTVDIESEEGWAAFSRTAIESQESERPPYLPTPSTAAELRTYALRAGFHRVLAYKRAPLVVLTAVKPNSERASYSLSDLSCQGIPSSSNGGIPRHMTANVGPGKGGKLSAF
jgi:ubiquinone/menaquinone biosynthesis C-methylase UbiE